jgi:endonuclease/exonuclease/phosphatase family metal-dependent hydrolase
MAVPPVLSDLVSAPNAPSRSGQGGRTAASKFYEMPDNLSRRYDHVYASPELKSVQSRYLTDWLREGLSDHAAVEAEFVVAN